MAKKQSKNKTMTKHFKRRMYERFNIEVTDEMLYNLIKQIQNGESEHIEKLSNNRTVHKLKINNVEVCVIYNSQRKLFHTVLPKDYIPGTNTNWLKENSYKSLSGVLY